MICPKCGYKRQASDNQFAPATECPACGVVYSKSGANDTASPLAKNAAIKKPSPVNEDTLKRARERVEMRLRKQMEVGQDDERREQTLQRARIFAADGVRQRQEEWKRQQMDSEGKPNDLTMSEAAIQVKDPTTDLNAFKGGALTMFGVVRPEMVVKEADDDGEKPARSIRYGKASVSLTDSLANRPPGDDLAYDTHPTNPALADVKPIDKEAAAAQDIKGAYEKFRAPGAEKHPIQEECIGGEEEVTAPPQKKQQAPEITAAAAETEEPQTNALNNENTNPALEEAAQPIEEEETAPIVEGPPEIPVHIVQAVSRRSSSGLMRLLPTVAWLILVAGLVGAVLSWTTLNDVQANMAGPAAIGSGIIPIALLLGFAYLATGVLGFAFFWVCSMISGQLRDIQQTLEMHAPYQDKEDRPS